jgi:hypothetical protein
VREAASIGSARSGREWVQPACRNHNSTYISTVRIAQAFNLQVVAAIFGRELRSTPQISLNDGGNPSCS